VHTLVEFRVPPESYPTYPSLPAAASKHLSWAFAPYSTRRFGSPLAAGAANTRYVPPAGFAYPLGGLLLPNPCRFSFTPAALLGFALRSFRLPKGIRHVSGRKSPPTVSPTGVPVAVRRWAGPVSRGFWVFTLPGIPGSRHRVSAPTAGCSLGLNPSRVCQWKPCPGSHPGSSLALYRNRPLSRRPPAPRSLTRPPLGLIRYTRQAGSPHEAALLGFSHRYAPKHLSWPPPGLLVHLAPRRTSLPTGRRSLDGHASLDRSCSGYA
jgi:hypothetical protein